MQIITGSEEYGFLLNFVSPVEETLLTEHKLIGPWIVTKVTTFIKPSPEPGIPVRVTVSVELFDLSHPRRKPVLEGVLYDPEQDVLHVADTPWGREIQLAMGWKLLGPIAKAAVQIWADEQAGR